jgi:multicomponent Na+:H+ antiporter subunit A
MCVGPLTLAALGLLFGLLPFVPAPLLGAAASAIAGEPVRASLGLWHGLNPALGLSVGTLALGLAAWRLREQVRRLPVPAVLSALAPSRIYDHALAGLALISRFQTSRLQTGSLRTYLAVVLSTLVVLVSAALLREGPQLAPDPSSILLQEVAAGLLILLAAAVAVRSRSRLAAVAAMGVAGYGVAFVYVLYGAPDLAMTQLAVETLTVVLFVLVLRRLPRFGRLTSPASRARDAAIALSVGVLVSVLVLVAAQASLGPRRSAYFSATAQPEAHGRNVVNVILVDFRGLDTLGEITVLATAALGVFAMLRLRPGREESA